MRLGKIERWILKHCYLKTVKRELPTRWRRSRGYSDDVEDFYYEYLFKCDVLLNYYPELRLSDKRPQPGDPEKEKFRTTKEYRRALATLTRVFRQLYSKELVMWLVGVESQWSGLQLTDQGKKIAERMLNS